jgi:hypothetical protein
MIDPLDFPDDFDEQLIPPRVVDDAPPVNGPEDFGLEGNTTPSNGHAVEADTAPSKPNGHARTKKRPAQANDIITEDSAALQFVEEQGNVLRYCHSTGAWFRWDRNIWRKDEKHLAFHWAREMARRLGEDADAGTRKTAGKRAFAGRAM